MQLIGDLVMKHTHVGAASFILITLSRKGFASPITFLPLCLTCHAKYFPSKNLMITLAQVQRIDSATLSCLHGHSIELLTTCLVHFILQTFQWSASTITATWFGNSEIIQIIQLLLESWIRVTVIGQNLYGVYTVCTWQSVFPNGWTSCTLFHVFTVEFRIRDQKTMRKKPYHKLWRTLCCAVCRYTVYSTQRIAVSM